jgi:hypothetical protein
MGLRTKTVTIASALAGLAVFSQAPEFAQQYRQRIGGAVDELKTVVSDFDNDASVSQLSRDQALDKLLRSNEDFAHDRGESMKRTIKRYERLFAQQGWLEKSHPITRPFLVLQNPDSQLMTNAWEIFEPAVPLNATGALYGGICALLALILARLGIGGVRRVSGGSKRAGQKPKDKKLLGGMKTAPLIEGVDIEPVADDIYPVESEPTSNSQQDENSRILAKRMENTLKRRTGIPGSMQVAPVREANVPYLKANTAGDEVAAKDVAKNIELPKQENT